METKQASERNQQMGKTGRKAHYVIGRKPSTNPSNPS